MRTKFNYKNHEGKVEERDVDVVAVLFDYMNHPEHGYQPGWFVAGWDYSRGRDGKIYRSFALPNIILPPRPDGTFNYKLMELLKDPTNLHRQPEIDPVTEFAMWLTTRKQTVTVGAQHTVYKMTQALEEWRKLKD